jgi:hypothetical protein
MHNLKKYLSFIRGFLNKMKERRGINLHINKKNNIKNLIKKRI